MMKEIYLRHQAALKNNLKKIAVMGWNHMDKFSQVHWSSTSGATNVQNTFVDFE